MSAQVLSAGCWSLWLLLPLMPAVLIGKTVLTIIVACFYALIVACILSYKLLRVLPDAGNVSDASRLLRRSLIGIAQSWAVALTICQAAIVLRLLNERGQAAWLPVGGLCRLLVEALSPVVPALRDLPADMVRHGFARTASVVTECYALAYAAAIFNLTSALLVGVWLLRYLSRKGELASLPISFKHSSLEKRLVAPLGLPLIVALYVYAIFLDTGVRVIPGRKEKLPHFETSEFHLYYRTLFGTGTFTLFICCLIGIIVFILCAATAGYIERKRSLPVPEVGRQR